MNPPIAYCHDCETTYVSNNEVNRLGPTPIYGRIGQVKHAGHDVRPVAQEGKP